MTSLLLGGLLLISFVGSLVAAIVACWAHRHAHVVSTVVLAISTLCGAIVAIAIVTGTTAFLALPAALYPDTATVTTHTWPWFYGMVLGLDHFSAIFYGLTCIISLAVAIFVFFDQKHRPAIYSLRLVNALTCLFIFGMQGVVLATNIVGFVAFWEIMSLTSFFLILVNRSVASRQAGFLYLVITHLSAVAIMSGLFLLSHGALLSEFSVLAIVTPQLSQTVTFVALGLLLFGFGSQAGLLPSHVWLPEAFSEVPTHVAALMSGVMINIAVYGLLRVILFVLPGVPQWFAFAIVVLGFASAVYGVLYAVLDRDLQRILAYSSIEYTGLIFTVLGVGLLASQEGSLDLAQACVFTLLFIVITHGLIKAGLFLLAGVVTDALHSRRLEIMGGLAKRMPQLSACTFILVLCLASLPPFAPFIAQWIFFQAIVGALATTSPLLQVVLVVTLTICGFVGGLRVFAIVKFYAIGFLTSPKSEAAAALSEPKFGLIFPSICLTGLVLGLSFFSPTILYQIGALELAPAVLGKQILVTGGGNLAPLGLILLLAGILFILGLIRRLVTDTKLERSHQVWDGGQSTAVPTATTATALSAPIRFLFRFFLRTQKVVLVQPLIPSNPWLVTRSMSLTLTHVWHDKLYLPIGNSLNWLAGLVGKLQHGRLQFSLGLILLTLLISLVVAL